MGERTIYIVEDDSSVRKGLSRLLRYSGERVEVFASAEEFLKDTSEVSGCLVADVRMPGMSGFTLQTELLKRKVPVGVVFMTGHGEDELRAQAAKVGAQFLTKPFDEAAILGAIEKAMETRS